MAESLPADKDNGSDVPLLDEEEQAKPRPPAYTAGDVGTRQPMQPYPPPANPQLAGPVAPSAVVQQAGHPAAVQFVRPVPSQQAVPVHVPVQPSVVQPVQYVAQAAPLPITAYPRPSYVSPHSYLALTIVTLIICALLNLTSLALGIPAMIMSILSYHAVQKNQWKSAENFGKIALYLSIGNWIYVLSLAVLAVGLAMGFYYRNCYYYYDYYSC